MRSRHRIVVFWNSPLLSKRLGPVLRRDSQNFQGTGMGWGDWVYHGIVQSWVRSGLLLGDSEHLEKIYGMPGQEKKRGVHWGIPDLLILWPWTWTFLISTLCLWYLCVLLEGYRQTAVYIKGEYEALKKIVEQTLEKTSNHIDGGTTRKLWRI